MYKSLGNRIAVVFLTATSVTLAHAQSGVPRVSVSRAVLVASDAAGIEPMAMALAHANISAGFVVAVDDRRGAATLTATATDSVIPLPEAIDLFLRKHSGYALRPSDWAMVIRPIAHTSCDAALDKSLPSMSISAPANEAFWRLARLVNPTGTHSAQPSTVCGGVGCDSNEQRQNLNIVLSLNGSATLQEALSQLVWQVPGLVWVIRDERLETTNERKCRLTYHAGDQHFFTSLVVASSKDEAK